MKRLILILLILCSTFSGVKAEISPASQEEKKIEDIFMPYYNEFMSTMKVHCSDDQHRKILDILIHFDDIIKTKEYKNDVGVTITSTYKVQLTNVVWYYETILIDKSNWKSADEGEKFSLIFHELMHAVFGYPDLKKKKYIRHFMYYRTQPGIKVDQVRKQFLELLDVMCKKEVSLSVPSTK